MTPTDPIEGALRLMLDRGKEIMLLQNSLAELNGTLVPLLRMAEDRQMPDVAAAVREAIAPLQAMCAQLQMPAPQIHVPQQPAPVVNVQVPQQPAAPAPQVTVQAQSWTRLRITKGNDRNTGNAFFDVEKVA